MKPPEVKHDDEEEKEEYIPVEFVPIGQRPSDNFNFWYELTLAVFLGVGWLVWEIWDRGLWIFFR